MPDSGSSDARKAPEGPVTFVNRFTLRVPDEDFESAFARTSRFMQEQPGFLRSTLMKEVGAEHQYVNIAEWTGAEALSAAVRHPDFPVHAAAVRAVSSSEHHLYRAAC